MSNLKPTPLGRPINYLIAVGVALVIGGIEMFAIASHKARPDVIEAYPVTVTATGCAPMALQVPAGTVNFQISNASDRPVEWEILDGVMVLAERENIAPGFSSVLSERLKPGVYDITCGLLSNPRGTLTVLATAQSVAETAAPPLREFIGPLSERKVQMLRAAGKFVAATQAIEAAVAAQDPQAAKTAWAEAAAQWARLGLVAPRASDLQNRIAPQADWLAGREADPGFAGLSRVEYALFAQNGLDGLAPVAAALTADAASFQDRVKALEATPEAIAADAARSARALSEAQTGFGLARYALDDRAQLAAGLDSIRRAWALIAPLAQAAKPEVAASVETALAGAEAALKGALPERAAKAKALGKLATALEAVNPTLGLD